MTVVSHNLMNVAHKVSDHHLHHEGRWQAVMTPLPLTASAPEQVCRKYTLICAKSQANQTEQSNRPSLHWTVVVFTEGGFGPLQDGITNRVGSDEFLPVCSPSLLLLSFCLPAERVRCSGGWSLFNVQLQNSEVHSFWGLSLRFIHDCIPHCVLYAAVKIDGFGFICLYHAGTTTAKTEEKPSHEDAKSAHEEEIVDERTLVLHAAMAHVVQMLVTLLWTRIIRWGMNALGGCCLCFGILRLEMEVPGLLEMVGFEVVNDVHKKGAWGRVQRRLGWMEAALVAGARDVGLSPSIVGSFQRKDAALVEVKQCFPRHLIALQCSLMCLWLLWLDFVTSLPCRTNIVQFFMDDCNHKLQEQLEGKEKELSNMLLADRIASIVRMRLEMNVPVITKWASALSIQVNTCTTPVSPFLLASYFAAKHVNLHLCSYLSLQCLPNLTCIYFLQANPLNAATALKQRAQLVDDIWHAAGDRSSDMDWYTKRALLGAVYMTAELYMLTDFTPGCGTLNSNSIFS